MPLKRDVTLINAVGMLVAGVLGSGVLILPSIAARIAGDSSILAWALMTTLATPIALTFGYLASNFPSAGGIAEYAGRAFGELSIGSVKLDSELTVGLLFLAVIPTATPVVILAGSVYAAAFLGFDFKAAVVIALLMLLLIFIVNVLGIKFTASVQMAISACVVLTLLAISLPALKPADLQIVIDSRIGKAMVAIFWSYMGWEAATHLSEEFKDPRDFYKSILLSLVAIGILYFIVAYAVIATRSYGEGLEGLTALIAISERSFGNLGAAIVSFLALLTCFSSANIYISSSSRLLFALARKGYLPSYFSRLNNKHVPHISLALAVLVTAAILLTMLIFGDIVEELILISNSVFILLYIIGSFSGLILLNNRLIPVVSLIVCSAILIFVGHNIFYPLSIIVVSILYASLISRNRARKIMS